MNEKGQPNVIMIVVDQMRADALAYQDNHPIISTPTLDMMASEGYHFENTYSVVPSCIPARVGLLTGLDAQTTGRVGYQEEVCWNFKDTLPQTFRDAGYQTQCIGKMHVYPSRKRLGFDHVLLHDGYLHVDRKYDKPYGQQFEYASDYLYELKKQLGSEIDLIDDAVNCNSWQARPWPYEERLHPTNWVVSESIKFLQRRDPTVPFFLKMAFEKPHAPLDPPPYYFDMYMSRLAEETDLHIGNWERLESIVPNIYALKGKLKADDQRRMLAGYYGLVSHLDHQIGRFLTALKEFRCDRDTVICFVSDHGDQLGEHYLFRKGYPYQGSIHVPFFLYDPANLLEGKKRRISELVKLQDIYPSLADLILGEQVPVDGESVAPLLRGETAQWRKSLYGEHCLGEDSSQYVMTKEWKFIWFSVRDEYQLFHLAVDPHEMNNVIDDPMVQDIVADLKQSLIEHLTGREEGFVQDGQLTKRNLDQVKPTLSHGL